MTKTSTPTHLTKLSGAPVDEMTADESEQQDELFYQSIKPQLNELIKSPSDETIQKILAYSKQK
ncbi:MAG: hypothetical protein REI78_15440 [Pedobacter sp.]|nr:hypothetical protein [Pedobacter sp.]MDQ8054424.1 hypothetical protein [Pedobacter sp.]